MNLTEMKAVVKALTVAEESGDLEHFDKYFDMEHDILYMPWRKKDGIVAEMLEAAGCHWDEDAESWAHF